MIFLLPNSFLTPLKYFSTFLPILLFGPQYHLKTPEINLKLSTIQNSIRYEIILSLLSFVDSDPDFHQSKISLTK